jgi:arabinogalactan oligomer/maltooligosaccharide transport system permease protein
MSVRRLLLAMLLVLTLAGGAQAAHVVLWHSYRGAEEEALITCARQFHLAHPDVDIELIAIPNETLAAKLTTAVPRGHGPDLFIFSHDRLGAWAAAGLIVPLEAADDALLEGLLPPTVKALRYDGQLWGWPLAFKSLALFYDKALVPVPPRTTDDLVAMAPALRARDIVPLAYEAEKLYDHAGWLHGFGGTLLDAQGALHLDTPGTIASLDFVHTLLVRGVIPEEVTGSTIASMFNERRAAMVLSGPWFVGDIAPGIDYGVAPLPIVSATGQPARPLLSVETVFLSARAEAPAAARAFARYLVGPEAALVRATIGQQTVATSSAWDDPRVAGNPVLAGFRAQLAQSVPMDVRPEMTLVWEPGDLALKRVVRAGDGGAQAAATAMRRYAAITRPKPAQQGAAPYLAMAAMLLLGLLFLVVRFIVRVRRSGQGAATLRGARWAGPAVVATVILVVAPFSVGLGLSLFSHHQGAWTFVGLGNFADILGARGYAIFEPLSFYYSLLVTILWTGVNVALHVGIGLGLAILLDQKGLRLRAIYRVLLVIPWAVPNYITALIWKTLFHKQYGAINGILHALGLAKVSWFSSFGTAFFANVCANAWLGFPFMMVVALGALQAIPRDLYEAADVDGAGAMAKLKHITLPLLGPAMLPAVLLGVVWTFNQFNVIYLVSGGEPDNSTDILISEAYRWAFARQEQYGYAAAYAALIFALLLMWSIISGRLVRRAEAAR